MCDYHDGGWHATSKTRGADRSDSGSASRRVYCFLDISAAIGAARDVILFRCALAVHTITRDEYRWSLAIRGYWSPKVSRTFGSKQAATKE